MLRHERACDAAKKTTKERRSFGLEEVHPGEPYGRPNSPQSPKNKQTASACLMGHIWGFVAASTAVVAFPCFVAFLPGHDPEAVVLHGEQPAGADRRLCCQHGLSGQDESRWRARTSLSRLESRLMCPECGSRRVSISTRWKRDFAPILVAHCGARAQPSGANREKQQGKEDCEA